MSRFEQTLASAVLEEQYVQVAKALIGVPPGPEAEPALQWDVERARRTRTPIFALRRMRSDVLLVQVPDGTWVGYRDVFEVDGRVVRDRDERVRRLSLSGSSGDRVELQRINQESARHNLGTFLRTVNTPTFPCSTCTRGRRRTCP